MHSLARALLIGYFTVTTTFVFYVGLGRDRSYDEPRPTRPSDVDTERLYDEC